MTDFRIRFLKLYLIIASLELFNSSSVWYKQEETIMNCEKLALRVGSSLADAYNTPLEGKDSNQRLHQDYIAQHLGFAPWMSGGVWKSGGYTLTGSRAEDLQKEGRWTGHPLKESPYNFLRGKWIYFYGDSTIRQIWASYAKPFQGNNFERNAKEWTRHYHKGGRRKVKHGQYGDYPEEGWAGPCGKNEVTCHVSGYDDNGLITFDWKHFPYDDYDEWIWGETGPWGREYTEEDRRPDVLVMQAGLHSCWHAYPESTYMSKIALERNGTLSSPGINETMIASHMKLIPKLLKSMKEMINKRRINESDPNSRYTTVIISTIGYSFLPRVDNCLMQFNRIVVDLAHKLGFPVFERGEIERRLMYKSIGSGSPFMASNVHLEEPGPSIVSTSLLAMMDCLGNNSIDAASEIFEAPLNPTTNFNYTLK